MASAIASCVSGLPNVSSKSSDEEKEMFFSLGWMASRDLPLSQTDVTDITDKINVRLV